MSPDERWRRVFGAVAKHLGQNANSAKEISVEMDKSDRNKDKKGNKTSSISTRSNRKVAPALSAKNTVEERANSSLPHNKCKGKRMTRLVSDRQRREIYALNALMTRLENENFHALINGQKETDNDENHYKVELVTNNDEDRFM